MHRADADEEGRGGACGDRQSVARKRKGVIAVESKSANKNSAGENDKWHRFDADREREAGENARRCRCPGHAIGPDRSRQRQYCECDLYVVMINASRLELKESRQAEDK